MSKFILHSRDIPRRHGTEYDDHDNGYYRDKQRVTDTVHEVDLRQTLDIVLQSPEALAVWQSKRGSRNIQLVLQGVHDHQSDRNDEDH
jgi:hypothetical protein